MKRRFLCALAVLTLAALPAHAEGGLVSALATSAPAAVEFETGGLRVSLPSGFEILEGDALAAYEAALQADYPDSAKTILAAMDAERGAAAVFAEIESDTDCLDAAKEAAETLIGDAEAAKEAQFGENRCAAFACAIGEQIFRLYYLSDGSRLIVAGFSGLEQAEMEEILAGIAL